MKALAEHCVEMKPLHHGDADAARSYIIPEIIPSVNRQTGFGRCICALPLFVTVGLLFSSTSLLGFLEQMTSEGDRFSLTSFMLFLTLVLCAPLSMFCSVAMANRYLPLATGCLLTWLGLLLTGLVSGVWQSFTFTIITGAGISISFQTSCLINSPYFLRSRYPVSSILLLLLCSVAMTFANSLGESLIRRAGQASFLYLSFFPLLAGAALALDYYYSREKLLQNQVNESPICTKDVALPASDVDVVAAEPSCCKLLTTSAARFFCSMSELRSTGMALLVWTSWGAGVDTTLLPNDDSLYYFDSHTTLTALQLMVSLCLFGTKLAFMHARTDEPSCKVNLASNYLQLGLLGSAGLTLIFLPESSRAHHNHMLFVLGLAMQYDDLTDLCLVPHSDPLHEPAEYRVTSCAFRNILEVEDERVDKPCQRNSCTLVNSLILFMASLFFTTLFSMIIGLPFAHLIGRFATLMTPLAIFSHTGLLIMSVFAVVLSLSRPESYIERKKMCIIST